MVPEVACWNPFLKHPLSVHAAIPGKMSVIQEKFESISYLPFSLQKHVLHSRLQVVPGVHSFSTGVLLFGRKIFGGSKHSISVQAASPVIPFLLDECTLS